MTSPTKFTVLLVDDDSSVLKMLSLLFADEYQVILASSGKQAMSEAGTQDDIAAVVLDMKMSEMDGRETARCLRDILPITPIIFHTGYPGEFDEGEIDREDKPFDYVRKGRSVLQLQRSVRNAVEAYRLRSGRLGYDARNSAVPRMVGDSLGMQAVYTTIRKVATSQDKVMILGETGTGKELVAQAVHDLSSRAAGKLGILNCNHKAPDLIESELFGHIKGSFTGAVCDRVGLFEYAMDGTVFLDEIGDLDITTQAKLLRVLETGEFSPIGSPEAHKTNARIMCATHKDLPVMVKSNEFREDLFYRLKGVVIEIPPLRSRKEDIPTLIEHFREIHARRAGSPPKIYDQSAIDMMIDYDWPGNVRELEETTKALQTLCDSDMIFAADVSSHIGNHVASNTSGVSLSELIKDYERSLIIKALSRASNNVSEAARILGVDRANLSRKIKNLRISGISSSDE